MEANQNDYHVSFFKPVTKKATKNRNMVIWLIIIWATAVFGFQILLRVIEKPVREQAYVDFLTVWDNVESGNAGKEDLTIFALSVLQLQAKVYVKPEYQEALTNAFTWAVFMAAEEKSQSLTDKLSRFEVFKSKSDNILDKNYISAKNDLENEVADILGLDIYDARRTAIPFTLSSEKAGVFTEDNKILTAKAMPLYMVHNRSVLTDTKFLGFPFHYFFTAVFLLILFIGLCWSYCYITDRRELKEHQAI
jgi:hypothetical protein